MIKRLRQLCIEKVLKNNLFYYNSYPKKCPMYGRMTAFIENVTAHADT